MPKIPMMMIKSTSSSTGHNPNFWLEIPASHASEPGGNSMQEVSPAMAQVGWAVAALIS